MTEPRFSPEFTALLMKRLSNATPEQAVRASDRRFKFKKDIVGSDGFGFMVDNLLLDLENE